MGPNQGITEYNVDFQQSLTNLAGRVTDEQVKIKSYRAGLQHDLRQLCTTSPTGARWARLQDLVQYATLQWPVVQNCIAKSKKSSQEPTVAGKRKASGSGGAKGKPKLGASAKVSNEQYQKHMAEKLYHFCHQPDHVARNCPQNRWVAQVNGRTSRCYAVPTNERRCGKSNRRGFSQWDASRVCFRLRYFVLSSTLSPTL
jgi:hypothetical protein